MYIIMSFVTVINDFTGDTVKSYVIKSTDTEDVLDYLENKLKSVKEPLIKKERKFIHSTLKIYKVEQNVQKGWIYNTYKAREVLLYTSEVVQLHTPWNAIKPNVRFDMSNLTTQMEKTKVDAIRDEFITELKEKVAERKRKYSTI